MATLRSRITVKVDGETMPNFPYERRLESLPFAQGFDGQVTSASANYALQLGVNLSSTPGVQAFLGQVRTGAVEMAIGGNNLQVYLTDGIHAGVDINEAANDTKIHNLQTTPTTRSRVRGMIAGSIAVA